VVNKLELTTTAKIFGDIKTAIISVASGALINGKCQMADNKNKAVRPEFSKQKKIELKPQYNKNEEIDEE